MTSKIRQYTTEQAKREMWASLPHGTKGFEPGKSIYDHEVVEQLNNLEIVASDEQVERIGNVCNADPQFELCRLRGIIEGNNKLAHVVVEAAAENTFGPQPVRISPEDVEKAKEFAKTLWTFASGSHTIFQDKKSLLEAYLNKK